MDFPNSGNALLGFNRTVEILDRVSGLLSSAISVAIETVAAFREPSGTTKLKKGQTPPTNKVGSEVSEEKGKLNSVGTRISVLEGGRCRRLSPPTLLSVLVPRSFPGHEFTDRRSRTRGGMLVRFDLGAGGFFADRANTQPDLLFFRAHLDDLEIMLEARV